MRYYLEEFAVVFVLAFFITTVLLWADALGDSQSFAQRWAPVMRMRPALVLPVPKPVKKAVVRVVRV